MDNFLESLYYDYENSFRAFKEVITTDYEIEAYPPRISENHTFGKNFPGGLIKKPHYVNCNFIETKFNSADGALSQFHDCQFDSCLLENCDFRYCDILETHFVSNISMSRVISCNFSFGNFIDSTFFNTLFWGCSFRQMQVENTKFENCTMQHCTIEQTKISNCHFENMDLRRVGVRYCTFENTTFDSVIFHILDLPRNYGLVELLKNSVRPVYVAYKNDQMMILDDAISYLKLLVPYYLETCQFYELICVYAIHHEYELIYKILPVAFKNVIDTCDFAALQDLCSLIVKLNVFSDKQLRDFYTNIKQFINPNLFPHYLRKSYNAYIENIKYILVDNPYDNPEAEIIISTNIESLDDIDMTKLLMSIESNINELSPNIDSSFKLTHHSPYDVVITLCGALPEILMVCQVFYYSLGGIKAFSDLKHSVKERTSKKDGLDINNEYTNADIKKHIEISIGKAFTFKYEKVFVKRVNSLEYTVKKNKIK